MGFYNVLRGNLGRALGPAMGICAIGYFAFHAVEGDRGVIALRDVRLKVEERRKMAAELSKARSFLEHRVRLLRPDSLDPDMLDERARAMLNLGGDKETVILLEDRSLARQGRY